MSSSINPNNIDGAYPVAGQDNNSQGFRDNFTNIKVNFQYAEDEINDLDSKAILKAALTGGTLDNNMNDNLIYAAKIQDFSATKVTVATTSGAIAVNYASGHYQSISTTGSISLSFTNFPATGSYGYIKLQLNITNVSHTVTLPGAVTLGTSGLQGYSGGVITFGATGTYEFGFGTYDGGTTITIFDLNRALTNFTAADLQVDDVTATGNIIAGFGGTGYISATGNVVAAQQVLATGNVTGANLSTAGLITATGNVTGGNLVTAGLVSATGNIAGGNVTAKLRPPAGETTASPVILTAAAVSNVAAATAGSFEYDGVVFYNSPATNQRGVLPTEIFLCLVSPYVANNSNSAQKVFNTPANGTVSLSASTTYFFEAVYYITRSLGSNSHTLSTLFSMSNSPTSISYTADTTSTTGNALGAVSRIYGTGITGVVVTAASTSTTENITVKLSGVLRTNAATTFIPQIQYDAAPGGAPTILANSYFRLTPVGNSTVGYVGNWS